MIGDELASRGRLLDCGSIGLKLARELATGFLAHVTAISGTRSYANGEIVIARVINVQCSYE